MIFLKKNNNNSLILVPAYNEELNIVNTLSEIPNSIDVLVINDGSTDKTEVLCEGRSVSVISHKHNMGYEAALVTGVEYFMRSSYDKFVVIDADGEINPKDAAAILEELNVSKPMICGYRKTNKGRLVEKIIGKISQNLFGIKDIYCGCKGFHRSILIHYDAREICRGIFTEFALARSRAIKVVNMPVAGIRRTGRSKFGSGLFINIRLFNSFIIGVFKAFWLRKNF